MRARALLIARVRSDRTPCVSVKLIRSGRRRAIVERKMTLRTTLLTSAALVAIAAVPAHAKGPFYFNVAGGGNWVSDDGFFKATATTGSADTLLFQPDADVGFVLSAAVGANLTQVMQGLRVEIEGSYRQNNVGGVWASNITTPTSTSNGRLDYDEKTWAVLANVWYDFDIGGLRPYVGGGLGWAHTELDGTYQGSFQTNPNFNFEGDGFAWQLGAGIKYAIGPNVDIGVAYRYFSAPDVDIHSAIAGNDATGSVDVNSHSVLFEMTFAM